VIQLGEPPNFIKFRDFKEIVDANVIPDHNWPVNTNATVYSKTKGKFENVTVKIIPRTTKEITVRGEHYPRGLIILDQENLPNDKSQLSLKGMVLAKDGVTNISLYDEKDKTWLQGVFIVVG
jgi:hypothetical protein